MKTVKEIKTSDESMIRSYKIRVQIPKWV